MKRYRCYYLNDFRDDYDASREEDKDGDYCLADDVIALETRLIAAETALLMASAGSVADVAKYMDQYPDPYIPN